MKKLIFLNALMFLLLKIYATQKNSTSVIQIHKNINKPPVLLECIGYANFFYYNVTFQVNTGEGTTIKPNKYNYSSPVNGNSILEIKSLDKQDAIPNIYYARNIIPPYDLLCEYDIFLFNDKSKHNGTFKIEGMSPEQEISATITNQAYIPTIIPIDPFDFNFTFFYKFEALPLKNLTIKINNEVSSFKGTICETSNENTDCLEVKDTLQIRNENKCPEKTIIMYLGYNLDKRFEFTDIDFNTFDSFEYKMNVQFPPIDEKLTSNLLIVDGNHIINNKSEIVQFNSTINCANPMSFTHLWNVTEFDKIGNVLNKNITTVITTDSVSIFEYLFNENFNEAEIMNCVGNGIGNAKCDMIRVKYVETETKPSDNSGGSNSATIIGIAVGSVCGLLIIVIIIIVVLKKCKQPSQDLNSKSDSNENKFGMELDPKTNQTQQIRTRNEIITNNDLYDTNTDDSPNRPPSSRQNRNNVKKPNNMDLDSIYSRPLKNRPPNRLEPLAHQTPRPLPPGPFNNAQTILNGMQNS